MSSVLPTLLAAVLYVFAVMMHELGHALVLIKRGIKIKRAGLGIPVRGLTYTWQPRRLDFPLTVSPLIVIGYVDHDEAERIEALPYRDKAALHASGVLMNFAVSLVLIALLVVVSAFRQPDPVNNLTHLAVCLGLLAAGWFGRAIISQWLVPLLGIGLGIMIVLVVVLAHEAAAGMFGGPLSAITTAHSSSYLKAVLNAAGFSLSIGLVNCLPFVPLDGGKIVQTWLPARIRDRYGAVTGIACLSFMGYLFFGDILRFLF